jgi:hypothetical protein
LNFSNFTINCNEFHAEKNHENFFLRGAYNRIKYDRTRILVATICGIAKLYLIFQLKIRLILRKYQKTPFSVQCLPLEISLEYYSLIILNLI